LSAGHPGGESAWESWWKDGKDGSKPRHLYFLGKDNIPFHTVIWPALIMGLNHANKGLGIEDEVTLPKPGDLHLEDNVPAMEYLMLAGGQFSKSRKHAIWLPSFLERFDPDTLRYYLGINMPENHDTDFNWPDFVEKINNELISTYGNFIHRVLSLGERLDDGESNPLSEFDDLTHYSTEAKQIEDIQQKVTASLEAHRYKEALRGVMSIAQKGNQMLQAAAPWKYLSPTSKDDSDEGYQQDRLRSLASLAFGWRISRTLAILTQPFLPFSSQRLWNSLGLNGQSSETLWNTACDWNSPMAWNHDKPTPLFKRLDLEEILAAEQGLVKITDDEGAKDPGHGVKGSKRKNNAPKEGTKQQKGNKMTEAPEGITYLNFETFMEVELRVGHILAVDDHPNADKLFVVNIDDGSDEGRTVCAGLKGYYKAEDMVGKSIVFVANLKPRKLRGVMSEGMMLAADDGKGGVRLVSIDGDIAVGSRVR
jgi:methionyl-tRNA synthetase